MKKKERKIKRHFDNDMAEWGRACRCTDLPSPIEPMENVILMMCDVKNSWRQISNTLHDAISPFNWHSLHSHFSFF